jgi:hypothetical protein
MSKRNAGRRGRTRKRRATGAQLPASEREATLAAPPAVKARDSQAASAGRERGSRRARPPATRSASYRDPGGVGERPEAPWHPWPFSELLILVGAIATIIGFLRGAGGRPALFAGLGAVMLGTLEFTIREHRSGYRAHTAMLASIPTALFHGGAALGLYALGAPRASWILVPVAIDVPLFWVLFGFLKRQFQDARRERVFALGRR